MRNRKRHIRVLVVWALAVSLVGVVGLASVGCASSADGVSAAPTGTSVSPSTTTTTLAPTTTSVPPTTASTTTSTASPSSTTTTIYTHPIGSPVRVVIPAIKADGPVVSVGVSKSGAMEVPSVKYVGWYKLGPAPGASGPAVLLGHVSYSGVHGTFYDIKRLDPGDQIIVYDKDGDYAVFQVDSCETTLKTQLPTDKIWNDTEEPVIRLITCGGKYDRQTKHYLSNVIVYAHLVR